jgi:hypothetical protein
MLIFLMTLTFWLAILTIWAIFDPDGVFHFLNSVRKITRIFRREKVKNIILKTTDYENG